MDAGIEIDALVAEKVMGCKLWRKRDALLEAKDMPGYSAIRFAEEYRCGCEDGAHRQDDEDDYYALLPYSTDIAAAWAVVERLQKDFDVKISIGHDWRYGQSLSKEDWLPAVAVEIRRIGESGAPLHYAHGIQPASAVPHAICLAALKAVGG